MTKADCSGTTGTVGCMSRTIKQSEQLTFRLQLFHTTRNISLQLEFLKKYRFYTNVIVMVEHSCVQGCYRQQVVVVLLVPRCLITTKQADFRLG